MKSGLIYNHIRGEKETKKGKSSYSFSGKRLFLQVKYEYFFILIDIFIHSTPG